MRTTVKNAPFQKLAATYSATTGSSDIVSDDQKILLPSYQSVKSALKRQRSVNIPKLPKSVSEICLENEWSQTTNGLNFVLHKSQNNDMIVFASDANLMQLSSCSTIYMDGTFKCCPSLFTQLFSIHGNYKGIIIPLVYVLLSSKTSATYYELFNVLRFHVSRLGIVLNPSIIISDFESGLIEAVHQQFPNVLHTGCHFHFTQAVWRKVQELGLSAQYCSPQYAELTKFIQLCMALAFISVSDVLSQFNLCVAALSDSDLALLTPFIAYFRKTWIDGVFPIVMWNQYRHDYQHRSNNHVEAWHASLQTKLPHKPNIFVLITALKLEHNCRQIEVRKVDAGENPPRRRPKYVRLEERRERMYTKFVSGQITVQELLHQARHLERTLAP